MADKSAVVAIGGKAGTGKSTVARSLASCGIRGGAVVWLSTDVVRKEMAGITMTERLPESFYTASRRTEVYEAIRSRAGAILREGRIIVWDASFGRNADRRMVEAFAKQCAVPFAGLMLMADLEIRVARVNRRIDDFSDADELYVRHDESSDFDANQASSWAVIDANGGQGDTFRVCEATIAGLLSKMRT